MKIAFITAMPEEFRAVSCHIDAPATVIIGQFRACSGAVSGHDVVVVESGMGCDNASRATEALLRTALPDILVSAGFCGAIASGPGVGDVVVATRLMKVSGGVAEDIPVELAAAGYNFIASRPVSAQPVFGGLFVTTPVIMAKTRIAELLPAGAFNPVAEMESAAIAVISAKNGIPFVGIRAVSDPACEEPGFSLDEFCDSQMRIRILRVLLTIVRKPRIIPQLVRLARNSRIAGTRLAQAVKQLLAFV